MRPEALTLRELRGPGELAQAEDLQLRVWGGSERDVFPRDALRALSHIGGLVAGALSGEEVVGLVVGLPTAAPGVQHSHLLAVHPAWRGAGLARRLKLYQREWGVARGVTRVEWTYDPLRAVNAHFNIRRLGAVASTYLDDFYGEMGGINAGVPSDRLVAVWDLTGPPPARPDPAAPLPAVNDPQGGAFRAIPPGGGAVRLHIPADLGALLDCDPARAVQWRLQTRRAFHALLGEGYRVTDFLAGETPAYVLSR
ncbi:GNAT family N-acetyltransferase [Deinococcus budaensis]|uniref:Putative GNAT superfamily acetyltransferase n=1 Tax=Deinococcus budaensis TaxID=1665626 RepID=A0A7W8GH19_9DEIO|nr:GNAT family N-acetyltransferase [Deinococcus budaensis]MBB5235485.1 putative GNAT superfamily acetyltransferase [Deinococcus budaensis]